MEIPTEKISSVNYGDIYQHIMILLFPSVFIDEFTSGNQEMKKKLDMYSLVISIEKYDILILHIKLPMKTNCCQYLSCNLSDDLPPPPPSFLLLLLLLLFFFENSSLPLLLI
jgi:hypothetical protein